MRTDMRESSLAAYDALGVNNLSRIQRQVVASIQAHNRGWVSRKQIAQMAGLEASTVAGRVNELIAAGRLVQDDRISKCPVTGRGVHKVGFKEA